MTKLPNIVKRSYYSGKAQIATKDIQNIYINSPGGSVYAGFRNL